MDSENVTIFWLQAPWCKSSWLIHGHSESVYCKRWFLLSTFNITRMFPSKWFTVLTFINSVLCFAEWLMYRYVFLILGTILLTYASTLSRSYAFYYVTTFSVGLILVGLLLCFQVFYFLKLSFQLFFSLLTYKRVFVQVVKHARSRRLEFFLYRFLVINSFVLLLVIPIYFIQH